MKKFIFSRLVTTMFMILCPLFVSAYDFTAVNEDGVTIYYNIIDPINKLCEVAQGDFKSATLENGRIVYTGCYSGILRIPETVNLSSTTLTVIGIAESAFACSYDLMAVTFPGTLKQIGHHAFSGCTSIKNLTFPNSVTSIGYYAFSNCTKLESIVIPDSVKVLEKGLFLTV